MTQTPAETMEQLDNDFLYMLSFPDKMDRNREAMQLHKRMVQFAHNLDQLTDQRLAETLRTQLGVLAGEMLTTIFEVDVP